MAVRTPKDKARSVPVATVKRRTAKNGSSTPKAKKPRSASRCVEVKIRLSSEEYARGQPYFQDQKYLPRFVLDAYTERVNRAEANNKAARLRVLAGNMELLLPILQELHSQEKLNFLFENIHNFGEGK